MKHKTGGGPPPPALTDVDQVILRTFGNTPSFRGTNNKKTFVHKPPIFKRTLQGEIEHVFVVFMTGILDMRFDTPIEVTEDSASLAEANRCGTQLVNEGSTIARTLSTTETIDCEKVLHEAQAIRQKRKQDVNAQVVSGTIHCMK